MYRIGPIASASSGTMRGSSLFSLAQDIEAVFCKLGEKFAYIRLLCYNITADKREQVLSTFFDLLLSLGGYYLILLPLLPFLRRHFSARACAALWLIPGFLYMTQQSYMKIPEPLLVIPASGNLVW